MLQPWAVWPPGCSPPSAWAKLQRHRRESVGCLLATAAPWTTPLFATLPTPGRQAAAPRSPADAVRLLMHEAGFGCTANVGRTGPGIGNRHWGRSSAPNGRPRCWSKPCMSGTGPPHNEGRHRRGTAAAVCAPRPTSGRPAPRSRPPGQQCRTTPRHSRTAVGNGPCSFAPPGALFSARTRLTPRAPCMFPAPAAHEREPPPTGRPRAARARRSRGRLPRCPPLPRAGARHPRNAPRRRLLDAPLRRHASRRHAPEATHRLSAAPTAARNRCDSDANSG
mmetsp:Transcript_4631/g.11703  ORF Transcript_4631/g.11703 Transcript_4631/m.11703 type:complete len:279 (-) Transcript_4631:206-1042(-)